MLSTILAGVLRIIGVLQQVATIVGIIQGQTTKTAQENRPFEIDTTTQETFVIVQDIKTAVDLLQTVLDTVQGQLLTGFEDTADLLNLTQRASDPVTLPTTPPTGYGGGDIGDVWTVPLGVGPVASGDLLLAAGGNAIFEENAQVKKPVFFPGGWQLSGAWGFAGQTNPDVNFPPSISPLTILLTDATIADWLTREYSFTPDGFTDGGYPYVNQPDSSWQWVYEMGDDEFSQYKASLSVISPISGLLVPPIWPGIANVTLSDEYELVDGLSIHVPMHGVSVEINSAPSWKGKFMFGPIISWRNAGAVAFSDDFGEYEPPQPLGMNSAVYSCRTMVIAAWVRFRVDGPFEGTVQTWTINP